MHHCPVTENFVWLIACFLHCIVMADLAFAWMENYVKDFAKMEDLVVLKYNDKTAHRPREWMLLKPTGPFSGDIAFLRITQTLDLA